MKRLWLIFAQTVTILLAIWFVVLTLKPQWLGKTTGPSTNNVSILQAPVSPSPREQSADSLARAVQHAAPAVVSIKTSATTRNPYAQDPWFHFFFGDAPDQEQSGLGSGVIMSDAGYILTNNHVIEGADAIEVTLGDGRSAPAKIIGTDPESDLAVLKIKLDKLPVMVLGDSKHLQVGDRVLAIGNPFGVGQTVTSGIVSALGRNQLGINIFEDFIQTDAAINPGNSGGALTDINGHLLGINTAIYSRSGGNMGIGFAIPAATARQVMQSIIEHGRVVRGWIGIEPGELTPELAQTFGVGTTTGVIVTGVLSGSPAAKAGIRPGDVITEVIDRAVRTPSELLTRVAELPPDQPAELQVLRGKQANKIEITPAQRPAQHRNPQPMR